MGGGPYLAARATMLCSYTMFVIGCFSAVLGSINMDDEYADHFRKILYTAMAAVGFYLLVGALVGGAP
eukprot:SAG11_NODE_35888_length_264_cov_1.103030_1_plen_67_part_01